MIVQETDFLAVLPRSVVRRSVSLAHLQVLPYPLPIQPMEVSLYHRPRNRQSEAQRWFSSCLKSALRTL
jgi:DNA-binding transcriptional LysR family regulator